MPKRLHKEQIVGDKQRTAEVSKRGRPRRLVKEARSNRIVAFVTGQHVVGLEQIAQEEGRSVSDVIHRIIAQHLKDMRSIEEK